MDAIIPGNPVGYQKKLFGVITQTVYDYIIILGIETVCDAGCT